MPVSHVKKHVLHCKQWRVISPQGINTPSVQTMNTFHEEEVLGNFTQNTLRDLTAEFAGICWTLGCGFEYTCAVLQLSKLGT